VPNSARPFRITDLAAIQSSRISGKRLERDKDVVER
jgi:hypothetical protein